MISVFFFNFLISGFSLYTDLRQNFIHTLNLCWTFSKGNLADRSRYLSLLLPPFDSLNIDFLIRSIPKILVGQ